MKRIFKIHCFILLLLLAGCAGGGSEGTGIKSLSGTVSFDDGTPLASAVVTVLETGDSSISDQSGNFAIETHTEVATLTIMVESDGISAQTQLNGLDPSTSNVRVDLTLRRGDASLIATGYLEVWARMVGDCAQYFRNGQIIKQKTSVPSPLSCTLRFFASGDGLRLERIRGQIEVRSCDSDQWRKIAEGLTGIGVNAGYGDIDFDYLDNRRNCVYRLTAPLNDPQGRSFEIFIHTLTFQNRKP